MMSKSRLFLSTFVIALAASAAGCADHPVAGNQRHGAPDAAVASSKKVTLYDVPRQVLEAAADLGYRPVNVKGRLLFCQREADTGSIISQLHCVPAARLINSLELRREAIHQIEQTHSGCSPTTC